ncbi:MAG: orotate phosphoribosyltransferase, partial [Acidimicrobiaceae bacterium]|nr:orotate phosphoribosyltransferase [Acidimicrobiaceae bacterium]
IVTLNDIVDHLHNREVDGAVVLDDGMVERIHSYREQHGA